MGTALQAPKPRGRDASGLWPQHSHTKHIHTPFFHYGFILSFISGPRPHSAGSWGSLSLVPHSELAGWGLGQLAVWVWWQAAWEFKMGPKEGLVRTVKMDIMMKWSTRLGVAQVPALSPPPATSSPGPSPAQSAECFPTPVSVRGPCDGSR